MRPNYLVTHTNSCQTFLAQTTPLHLSVNPRKYKQTCTPPWYKGEVVGPPPSLGFSLG